MRRLVYFLSGIFLLVGGGLFFSILASKQPPSEVQLSDRLPPPRAQDRTKRLFPEITFERLRVLGDRPETFLNNPDFVRLGPDGSVYVFDRGTSQVIRFDPETGQILQRYGHGPGQGPGEFAMVSDFEVDREGRVYVCDAENGRISLFAPDGRLLASLAPKRPPYHLALLSGQRLVVEPLDPYNDALFELYRLESQNGSYRLVYLGRFGEFLERQEAVSLLLDGLITGADSFFVYTPRRIGWIAAFRPNGDLKYYRTTIEPVPIPKLIRQGSVTRVDRSAPRSTYATSVDRQHVYLDKGPNADKSFYQIDVYDAQTGTYRFTIPFPERAGLLHVHDSLIYAVQDTVVTIWRWQIQSDHQ